MEDVIFAGTRERKSLGMAEVSLSLIDPEAYAEGPLLEEPQLEDSEPEKTDWDEDKIRAERAAETEEIIAEVQPGKAHRWRTGEAAARPSTTGCRRRTAQRRPATP